MSTKKPQAAEAKAKAPKITGTSPDGKHVLQRTPLTITASPRDPNQIIAEKIKVNDKGLTIGATITAEECVTVIKHYMRLEAHVQFHLGDLFLYCREKFAETVDAISNATGVDPKTLAKYISIAKSVPPANRIATLPWSTHAAVAKLPLEKQKDVLADAAKTKASVREVKKSVRDIAPKNNRGRQPKPMQTEIDTVSNPPISPATPSTNGGGVSTPPEAEKGSTVDIEADSEAQEQMDAALSYLKSPKFEALPLPKKREWRKLLDGVVREYENLLTELGD